MTLLTIDLTKNPELAALVADKEIGDYISLDVSIKSMDEQTLVARIESCDEGEKPDDDDDSGFHEEEPDDPPSKPKEEPAEKPGKSLARKLAPSSGY